MVSMCVCHGVCVVELCGVCVSWCVCSGVVWCVCVMVCVCVCGVSVKKGRTAYDRKIGTDSGMKSLRPEVRSLKRLIKLTAHFQY